MSSFYNTGGKFMFFFYDMNVFKDVPFGITWQLQKGILKLNDFILSKNLNKDEEEYKILLDNMMDSYCSYIENYIDIKTGEISSLPLYRLKSRTTTHNVYSSMFFVTAVTNPTPFESILKFIKEKLNIDDMNLIKSNYYDHFYSDKSARTLVITETKIYFWWYLLSKNFINTLNIKDSTNKNSNSGKEIKQENIHIPFFIFYLWCFRNLGNLNEPFTPGNRKQLLPSFDSYFRMIESADLDTQFKLRYGPKYLTKEELIMKPKLILRKFR